MKNRLLAFALGLLIASALVANGQQAVLSFMHCVQSGTWNITNVSGTVSLPTGAATSANQTNGSQVTTVAAGSANIGGAEIIDSGGANKLGVNGSGQAAIQAPPTLPLTQFSQSVETSTLYNGTSSVTIVRKAGVDSTNGATTIVSAVASQSVRVLYFGLSSNGTVNANLQSHTTTTNTGKTHYLAQYYGYETPWVPVGLFATTSGEALDLNLSAGSINVSWEIVYVQY
jgi:hypothetical protein